MKQPNDVIVALFLLQFNFYMQKAICSAFESLAKYTDVIQPKHHTMRHFVVRQITKQNKVRTH